VGRLLVMWISTLFSAGGYCRKQHPPLTAALFFFPSGFVLVRDRVFKRVRIVLICYEPSMYKATILPFLSYVCICH
jgi:hypothetical protein